MFLSLLLFISGFIILLVEPFSALHLIAAGVLVVSGAFNALFRTYMTYVLTHPETKQVYVGRTSGFGAPAKILRKRMYGHVYIKKGFANPLIDRAMQGHKGYWAVRGREQQLIDFYGGVGHQKVANMKRGVSRTNKYRRKYNRYSNKYFGSLTDSTTNK